MPLSLTTHDDLRDALTSPPGALNVTNEQWVEIDDDSDDDNDSSSCSESENESVSASDDDEDAADGNDLGDDGDDDSDANDEEANHDDSDDGAGNAHAQFKARIEKFAAGTLLMPITHFNLASHTILHRNDVNFWAMKLYNMATTEVRDLLDRDDPPTRHEMESLQRADKRKALGNYFLSIKGGPPVGSSTEFGYSGSATGIDRWIATRVSEHSNGDDRQGSYLQRLLDDPDVHRNMVAVILADRSTS
ncbi:uncharacterized protein BKA78DRAFT_304173 [Phyllosticta capitalensis]|uniref:uncharacterized protein n=1 Tax=Phyllosticta capitalensis TaxID=121624 RepID=UPI00312E95F1